MEEKKSSDIKFYKGLLIALIVGLFLIFCVLLYLWLFLRDYEACYPDYLAAKTAKNYSGDDIYYYEDSIRGSGQKRYRIQDGDRRLATLVLVPDGASTAYNHQKYRISAIIDEKDPTDDVMQVVAETDIPEESVNFEENATEVSSDEAEKSDMSGNAADLPEEDVPSLPITDDEKNAVTALAESYVKVYAPFSTIKEIGELRSQVLALIKKDTNLYKRLSAYSNSWGQNVNGYEVANTTVTNIKKTSENTYTCDVASEFITSSADWGVKRTYDLTYYMEMEDTDGKLLLTSVE